MAGNTDTDAPWLLQRFPDGRKMYFPGGCRKKAVLSSDDRGASLGGNLFIWNGWLSASFQWLAGSEHKESGTASLADFSLPAEKEAAGASLHRGRSLYYMDLVWAWCLPACGSRAYDNRPSFNASQRKGGKAWVNF